MLTDITACITELLNRNGIRAGRAYPAENIDKCGSYVRTRLAAMSQRDGAFASYLGIEWDENGTSRELYGLRCDIELALDIYVYPKEGDPGELCEEILDSIIIALGKSEDIKIAAVKCGGAAPDKETGMFLCPCKANANIMLVAEKADEGEQFSDFHLKGEIRK